MIDYAFHMILARSRQKDAEGTSAGAGEAQGHASLKVFMTYDRLKVDDENCSMCSMPRARTGAGVRACREPRHDLLDGQAARREGLHGAEVPHRQPSARAARPEAFNRLIAFAALVDQPIMIFHVSTAEGVGVIRQARGRGLKVFAETCPQYLFMTGNDLDKPGLEGAKWMCSPPPRDAKPTRRRCGRRSALGDLQVISSDHAPYAYDETGKLMAGTNPTFKQIANGMPGIEARLPVLFDAMVSKGRLGLHEVRRADRDRRRRRSTASIRGRARSRSALMPTSCIWDPERKVTLGDSTVHDRAGYTPYAGRTVTGWPQTVMRRGEVIVRDGSWRPSRAPGPGLPRAGGARRLPLGRLQPTWTPRAISAPRSFDTPPRRDGFSLSSFSREEGQTKFEIMIDGT